MIDAPGSPAADTIPATGLLEEAVMSDLMRRFRPDVWKTAPRAVFSFWTQHYFLRLLPPVLAANLMFERDLTLDLDRVTVVIDAEGLPARFLLHDTGTPLPAGTEGAARFARLETNHLTPLIMSWSAQTRLSPRLFQGNLARYVAWVLAQLPELGAEAAAPALKAWLSESILAEPAQRQPFCLRDHLPRVAICDDCPKLNGLSAKRVGKPYRSIYCGRRLAHAGQDRGNLASFSEPAKPPKARLNLTCARLIKSSINPEDRVQSERLVHLDVAVHCRPTRFADNPKLKRCRDV